MARLNTSAEVWDALTEVGYIRDVAAGTPSTLDGAHTEGDTTVNVAAGEGSNFSEGDLIRIGSGEELEIVEIESIATDALTVFPGLGFDHDTGVAVVEQEKVDMGHVAEGGVTLEASEDTFEVRASTAQGVLIERTTGITQRLTWPAILWSMENLAVVMGMAESEVTGSGTASDPDALHWIADKFNSLENASVYAVGTLEDGTNLELRGHNVKFDLNKSASLARNAVAELPTGGRVQSMLFMQWS